MRLFKVYEMVLLHLVSLIYLAVTVFIIDTNMPGSAYTRIYEASIILLLLYLAREVIIAKRIERIEGERIVPVNDRWNIVRMFLVLLFFVVTWLLIGTVFEATIIFVGSIFSYVLPKPVTEGHYSSTGYYIHKAKVYEYEDIGDLKYTEAGDVVFKYKGHEERIAYISQDSKLKVYEWLIEKVRI